MDIAVRSVTFVFAAACAAVMGFAIQRGATCTVAAVDEIVGKGRFAHLAAMAEASVWVAGGLALVQTLRGLPATPAGYPVTTATLLGGTLLGFGAYVNRACVFGAVARLGSGEWAYVVTPLGFYAGCLSLSPVFRFDAATPFWTPHAATAVIGVTFLAMLLAVGAWAYTDALAGLAHGMAGSLVARSLLLLALFGGAIAGGLAAGRFRSIRVSTRQLARCFGGGMLMGWGSLLIPGGNDGLVLVGMPLLWPYAWVAFAAMCVAIGAALAVERRVAARLVRA